MRADEMAQSRASKLAAVSAWADKQNKYLAEHKKADAHKAYLAVWEKADRLKLGYFVTVKAKERRIVVEVDEEYLAKIVELDGCYAIKTDLPKEVADVKTVHDRYKDLALVERAFRTMKT